MWSEQAATAFFASHPQTRTMALLAVGSIISYAKNDWDAFKKAQLTHPGIAFNWGVASLMWLEGLLVAVLIGVAPAIGALILRVLGGGVLPTL